MGNEPAPAPGDDRERADRLDAADPLGVYRREFAGTDDGLIYLDGNSLGRMPVAAAPRVRSAVEGEWARGLVASWEHWITLPRRVGDAIAPLVGAAPGEVLVTDQTSVNLFKLATAALGSGRPDIVTDDANFPSDLYVLGGVAAAAGGELRVVPTDPVRGVSADDVAAVLDGSVGLVSHSHVAFRSGALADMDAINAVTAEAGAMTLWDLSHSVGVVPIDLRSSGADLAVGCTYKYLNGGPGAPAFLYVRDDVQQTLNQPIQGWWSHDDMFAFAAGYVPAAGIERFAAGTPPILSLVAAQAGIEMTARAGLEAIRAKSMSLTSLLIELADRDLAPLGFTLATPRDPARRGSHVAIRHDDAYRISLALRDRDVVADFRTPDIIRLGVAPLYTTHREVIEAVGVIRDIGATGAHEAYPQERASVT